MYSLPRRDATGKRPVRSAASHSERVTDRTHAAAGSYAAWVATSPAEAAAGGGGEEGRMGPRMAGGGERPRVIQNYYEGCGQVDLHNDFRQGKFFKTTTILRMFLLMNSCV